MGGEGATPGRRPEAMTRAFAARRGAAPPGRRPAQSGSLVVGAGVSAGAGNPARATARSTCPAQHRRLARMTSQPAPPGRRRAPSRRTCCPPARSDDEGRRGDAGPPDRHSCHRNGDFRSAPSLSAPVLAPEPVLHGPLNVRGQCVALSGKPPRSPPSPTPAPTPLHP